MLPLWLPLFLRRPRNSSRRDSTWATPGNNRIDWTRGALSLIARSPCDEATQGPRDAAPGLLRCTRNDGLGVGSLHAVTIPLDRRPQVGGGANGGGIWAPS